MNYLVQNNEIYDRKGNMFPADERGIVKVVIDDKERRFVKEKFITFLRTNPGVVRSIKPAKVKKVKVKKEREVKVVLPKEKVIKPRKKQKPRKKETVNRSRNGIMITAVKGDATYGPFISLSACAREIGLVKSTVSKIIRGVITGSEWSFEKVKK